MRNGVYIGKDIELVTTDKYMIIFHRKNEDFLESRLYQYGAHTMHCIGICRTSPPCSKMQEPPKVWQSAFIYNDPVVTIDAIIRRVFSIEAPVIQYDEHGLKVSFGDGQEYTASCDETFSMQDLSPEVPSISDSNIGECLQLWNMGLVEESIEHDGIKIFIGVTINTKKHMYIFEMTPNSVYCRAARYVAINKGVVFNQNFRQGFEAYMIEDNGDARRPLEFNETFFNQDACNWKDRSVYWSVKDYNNACITLNGCQGEAYYWKKPIR